MTEREKYIASLADLVEEKERFGEWWEFYYANKIEALNAVIEEKFGGGSDGITKDDTANKTISPPTGA